MPGETDAATSAARREGQALLPNLLLSVAVGAVFVGGLEGLARLVEKPQPAVDDDRTLCDWAGSRWKDEFYTLASERLGWPTARRFNNEGLRDLCRPVQKPEGAVRVACLGDSVTYGWGLNPRQALPQVLERRLRARGIEADVLSVALPAWSTRQERIAYRRIARKYSPDQVIVGVCFNDIGELQYNLRRPPALLVSLYARSALVRRVVGAPAQEQESVRRLVAGRDAWTERAFKLLFDELLALKRDVQQDGTRLAVVVFPFRFQVEGNAPPPIAQERLRTFCRDEALPFLDLLPGLLPLGSAAFVDHSHLSPEGNERAAALIEEAGLVPGGPSALAQLEGTGFASAGRPPTLDQLRQALTADDPGVRRAAAWAAGEHAAAGAPLQGALIACLDDPAEVVRLACARSLPRLGPSARVAVPRLFAALADPREAVRWAAADALNDIGVTREDLLSLVAALHTDDIQVQAFASWTLGRMGADAAQAAPDLARLLESPEPALRARAAHALGRIGPAAGGAALALKKAQDDPDEEVRAKAKDALERIGEARRPS